jgi:predicted RNase H-like nuclease (RuvC/YqgF family)
MATMPAATVKKPRTSVEVVPQLATLPERVGVLETRVENINEKLVDLKADVKEMHDCLDRTGEKLDAKLCEMQDEYRINSTRFFEHADRLHAEDQEAHKALATKVSELEKFKSKGTLYIMLVLAFCAGTGWVNQDTIPLLLKFFGL